MSNPPPPTETVAMYLATLMCRCTAVMSKSRYVSVAPGRHFAYFVEFNKLPDLHASDFFFVEEIFRLCLLVIDVRA